MAAKSTEMIFKILSRKSAVVDEVEAVNRLLTKLGGLPLAVNIIAKQIRLSRRFRSVAEYLPYFEQNQRSALERPKRGHRDPGIRKAWTIFGKRPLTTLAEMLPS
jgi:hypothetical protein